MVKRERGGPFQDLQNEMLKKYQSGNRPIPDMPDAAISASLREALRMSDFAADEMRLARQNYDRVWAGQLDRIATATTAAAQLHGQRIGKFLDESTSSEGIGALLTREMSRFAPNLSMPDTQRQMAEFTRSFQVLGQIPPLGSLTDSLDLSSRTLLSQLEGSLIASLLPSVQLLAASADSSITRSAMRTAMNELRRPARLDDVTIHHEADLTTASAINEQLAEVLARSGGPQHDQLSVFLNNLVALARRVPKSLGYLLLMAFIFVLKAVVENETQYYSGELLAPMRRVVLAKMRTFVGETVPEEQQRILRIVVAKGHLCVRRNPQKSDSRIIGNLPFGTVVVSLRQKNAWMLIEYSDGDIVTRGWVYGRYLQRLHVPSNARLSAAPGQ